jgi:hypothetical protein
VEFPGDGEALGGEFERARLLEGEPGEVTVAAVGARRAARHDRDAVPGRRGVGEGVRVVERKLRPQGQAGRWPLGAPRRQVPGDERQQQVAALGERGAMRGQPVRVDRGQQPGGERLADDRGAEVERGLAR